ncbi:uncharacterized protein LOC131622758 [Vicia villosa]|uniref:uncharacterized protein LOC131622758 n=1 Tax=Vicia villosa TaxID=3911 RepID=UPI00273AD57C|nr:uncharacterized protein LOC131622758 [Vicia villosa]
MDWKLAQRKIFRAVNQRWDCFPFNGGRKIRESEVLVTIFFSDIPNRINAKGVFDLFGCHGDVVEVVIPPRRNNLGKRFGFARFVGVEEARLLGVRLDNIIIDGKKIHANVPRFERSISNRGNSMARGKVAEESGVRAKESSEPEKVSESRNNNQGYRKGWSFAEAVGKVKVVSEGVEVPTSLPTPVLNFVSKVEDKERLRKAYVGVVLNPGSAYNIQTHFEVEGVFSIKVSPLGSNLCLLEETETGFIRELIGEGQTWWKQWFKEVRPWEETGVDPERVVWF